MTSSRLHFPLPEELTIDILLRLPFESLLECKRVSKQWKYLINHPKFHSLYRNKSFVLLLGRHSILYCVLIRHDGDNFTVHRLPIRLSEISDDMLHHHLLSGWSNGMVCVKEDFGPFHVYDLFTGVSYRVAEAPLQEHSSKAWICCGFGYDRYDDDYKILVVCEYRSKDVLSFDDDEMEQFDMNTFQNEDNSLFWVYSFRSGRWESFHGFPSSGRCMMRPEARFFNGVLHWVRERERRKRFVIVTYDLHTRKFGEIMVPSIGCSDKYIHGNVSELDGRLCFVNETHVCGGYDMEVYSCIGDGESWTKLFNFHLSGDNILPLRWLAYTMLYECGDGRKMVLFVCNYRVKLFWYDINKKEIQITQYHVCDDSDCDD